MPLIKVRGISTYINIRIFCGQHSRVQSVKHGGIYPLQDFKCLTNGMGKLNNMAIHGGRSALRTLT